jgi:uncharacterized protein YdeI (YjbR/CyaY-like superfamily)
LPTDDLPELAFAIAAELEAWLEVHHDTHPGLWVKIAKKATGVTSVSYEEVVESLLCFGWIDGLTHRVDEVYYAVRCTPRRRRSPWSDSNVQRIARLTAQGRLRPAGLAQVESAKTDGRWPL